jgi:hypothetical protein
MTDAERIEVLALAYALLDGSPWYRGLGTNPDDAHCAVTAFSIAFREKQQRWQYRGLDGDYYQLRCLIDSVVPGGVQLPAYNDAPGRRKRDVLRLYEKAAAKIGK